MTQQEIAAEYKECGKRIQEAQNRIKELHEICTHPNTFEGEYQWRVGSTFPATICSDCGKVTKHNWLQSKLTI